MARAADAPFVFLVESDGSTERERALLFTSPERLIECRDPRQVPAALAELDRALGDGYHVSGFLAYEAGYGLDPRLAGLTLPELGQHALWFGVFARRQELHGAEVAAFLAERAGGDVRISPLRLSRQRADYHRDFARIQGYLHAGESYQVCQSLRARFSVEGTAAALFARLRAEQPTSYSALIDTGEYSIVSLSPELFFRKQGDRIELEPMKGTAAPGRDAAHDAEIAARMRADPKTLAENVMIVDLLRNDVGRVARAGSVQVPRLFTVERFGSVLQMTSTITAQVEPALGLLALMRALFPSGSVTGAPKLRTMQIIHELEAEPRGIFCGSIGFATPAGDACFNVAIRSLLLDSAGAGVLGVGSGIVVDSEPDAELAECLLKAGFVERARR